MHDSIEIYETTTSQELKDLIKTTGRKATTVRWRQSSDGLVKQVLKENFANYYHSIPATVEIGFMATGEKGKKHFQSIGWKNPLKNKQADKKKSLYPATDTPAYNVWRTCDRLSSRVTGKPFNLPDVKPIIAACAALSIKPPFTRKEYAKWKKYKLALESKSKPVTKKKMPKKKTPSKKKATKKPVAKKAAAKKPKRTKPNKPGQGRPKGSVGAKKRAQNAKAATEKKPATKKVTAKTTKPKTKKVVAKKVAKKKAATKPKARGHELKGNRELGKMPRGADKYFKPSVNTSIV